MILGTPAGSQDKYQVRQLERQRAFRLQIEILGNVITLLLEDYPCLGVVSELVKSV